jgi:hypothetical protein
MQLADELPMLALVLHTAYVLWCRPTHMKKKVARPLLFRALCLFCVCVTLGLIVTNRSQTIHSVFRGLVTYTFSAAFLYIFVAQSAAAADLDKRFPSKNANTFGDIFTKGFCCFLVAIAGWITENMSCSHLQSLPFNLPFPHFHGILWHLGCAAGRSSRYLYSSFPAPMHITHTTAGLHYLLLIAIVCDSDDQEKSAKLVKVGPHAFDA